MKTLNLVYPEKSDIKYKISKFPDGQQNIVIDSKTCIELSGAAKNWYDRPVVTIKSRLNNFLDLELIICTVASLHDLDVKQIHLYTPYIMGARSDRRFEIGGNNYLKKVICPIINAQNFESVTCIDPHSDVLEACINNFRKINNENLLMFAIGKYEKKSIPNFILISPDAGANKKIYKLAEHIHYKGDIITCTKDRDTEGKLSKINVPIDKSDNHYKDMIIIDDICDGGATFINIAKEIQSQKKIVLKQGREYPSKLYLVVTHGIFSKGFEELHKYFDKIYCTNSYRDFSESKTVLNVF